MSRNMRLYIMTISKIWLNILRMIFELCREQNCCNKFGLPCFNGSVISCLDQLSPWSQNMSIHFYAYNVVCCLVCFPFWGFPMLYGGCHLRLRSAVRWVPASVCNPEMYLLIPGFGILPMLNPGISDSGIQDLILNQPNIIRV